MIFLLEITMGNIDNLPNFESLFSPVDNKDKEVLKHDEGHELKLE
jgi:hypothetical protein